jgi:hypothetical protein
LPWSCADDDPVWPHLSLAYARAAVLAAPFLDALAAVADPAVPARFRRISLIELRRAGRRYQWRRIAKVVLGPPQPGR